MDQQSDNPFRGFKNDPDAVAAAIAGLLGTITNQSKNPVRQLASGVSGAAQTYAGAKERKRKIARDNLEDERLEQEVQQGQQRADADTFRAQVARERQRQEFTYQQAMLRAKQQEMQATAAYQQTNLQLQAERIRRQAGLQVIQKRLAEAGLTIDLERLQNSTLQTQLELEKQDLLTQQFEMQNSPEYQVQQTIENQTKIVDAFLGEIYGDQLPGAETNIPERALERQKLIEQYAITELSRNPRFEVFGKGSLDEPWLLLDKQTNAMMPLWDAMGATDGGPSEAPPATPPPAVGGMGTNNLTDPDIGLNARRGTTAAPGGPSEATAAPEAPVNPGWGSNYGL